jgi:hypothetical protein
MKMTGKAVQVKTVADGLIELKERFAAWRAVRKLGLRIPRELWPRRWRWSRCTGHAG